MSRLRPRRVGAGLTIRGLWQRRLLSLVVYVTAVLAAAAAAIGPMYTQAARTAILRDAFIEAAPDAQGIMVIWENTLHTGPVYLEDTLDATGIPGAFGPPIRSAELSSKVLDQPDSVKLIWREGACARLRLVSGRCPSAPGEVVASRTTSDRYDWAIGEEALLEALIPPRPPGVSEDSDAPDPLPLTVVGIYEPRDPQETYWFGLRFFPDSIGQSASTPEGQRLYDPLFTDQSTLEWASSAGSLWNFNLTAFVDIPSLTGDDAESLRTVPARLREWTSGQATVFTALETTAGGAIREQNALGVPVTIVILELVGLSWLLLFLAIRDLVQARRLEIGLARLRGLSRLQTWRFTLGEPVALLLAALPVGVLVSVPIVGILSRSLLGSDIPVSVGGQVWLAAGGAILGGLLAAVLAARATVTTSVMEQWQSPRFLLEQRSWVLDAIVLTLVAAGLVELTLGGLITEASGQQATALLVPVLISIAVALVTIRVLPYAARAAFKMADRRSGIGGFIGLRLAARSQGTASTVIVLAAAFSLAVFALAAWTTTVRNHRDVATVQNGAATVFVVATPEGSRLTKLVDGADPGGRSALPVGIYDRTARLIAVDIERFPHVANWEPDFASQPLGELLPQLRPPAAPPIMLSGDEIRVTVDSDRVTERRFTLSVDLELPDRVGRVRLPLVTSEQARPAVLSRRLSQACHQRCELRGFTVEDSAAPAEAKLVITKIEVHSETGWQTIDAGLTTSGRWRVESQSERVAPALEANPNGLALTYITVGTTHLVANTHPPLLPAITVGDVGPRPIGHQVAGLDGIVQEEVSVVTQALALPGATGPTALVDYETADRAAFGISSKLEHQVWVAPGAETRIKQALQEQGVHVTAERTVADLERQFNRQGPGLSIALLLVTAAAGAILAMARAALGLYTAGRQRSYQFAVLQAIGTSKRAQRAALLIEQAITLGVGVLAGTVAGVAAASVTLRRIPQFTTQPTTPPLTYTPDPVLLATAVGVSLVAIAVVVVLTTEAIRRSVKIDQLRQAAP